MKFIWQLMLVSTILQGCNSSFRTYKVSDGITVLALRSLEDVYPTFASSTKFELDLALKTKYEIGEVTLGSQWEEDIVKLYEDLDQLNYEMRSQLVTAYSGFVTSLSVAGSAEERSLATARWDKQLGAASELALRLRELNQQIGKARTSSSSTEYARLIEVGTTVLGEASAAMLLSQ